MCYTNTKTMSTNLKIQALELRNQGISYGQIAKQLGIGKTTAFYFVKEAVLQASNNQNMRSELAKNVLNGEPKQKTQKIDVPKINELSGDELIKMEFDCLPFTGKFLDLIGKPSKIFSAIIWGLPKGGKSNLALRFADYLQEYFGNVVYISAEEGFSQTMKDKLSQIGGSKVTIAHLKDYKQIHEYLEARKFDFVFIDSINIAGIDNNELEALKAANPSKSFVSIVQATKGGNFKGDQGLTHNCDFIIKVVDGIAYHNGRFNTFTEVKIFDEILYEKNPEPRPTVEIVSDNEKEAEFAQDEKQDIKPIEVKKSPDLSSNIVTKPDAKQLENTKSGVPIFFNNTADSHKSNPQHDGYLGFAKVLSYSPMLQNITIAVGTGYFIYKVIEYFAKDIGQPINRIDDRI